MKRTNVLYVTTLFLLTLLGKSYGQENLLRNRFLLLDSRLIEKVQNAELVVGTVEKHPGNPLFSEDKPWEKRFDNLYGNVIYDKEEGIYKCWYSPFIVDHSSQGMTLKERNTPYEPPDDREMGICYATSEDGISWEKPNLGLVEFENSKQNNIIWRGPHGAGIYKDWHDPDPDRRYKAIFQGLSISVSNDGLEWQKARQCEGVETAGDTHNNTFWAPTLSTYVGITRTWNRQGDRGIRQVARIESKDFNNWTPVEVVLQGSDPNLQTYAMPVFFHGGVYLGLLAVHDQKADRVWTELTWSPDTKHWNRISPGTPLIPNSDKELDYDYGCVYACAAPVFLENEIRLYYGGSDWLHFGWRNGNLSLATLRLDGFASYEHREGVNQPGIIITKPLTAVSKVLRINADIDRRGYVKVKIFNEKDQELAESELITRTVTDAPIRWKDQFSLEELRGKILKLNFEFKNAKIYSFSFE